MKAVAVVYCFLCTLLLYYLANPPLVAAAIFLFDPQTRSAAVSESFSVDLKIDTKGKAVNTADAVIKFDPALIEVIAVTPGSVFEQNFKSISASEVLISGFPSSANIYKTFTGSGIMATLTLRLVKDGSANLTFDCTAGKTSDSNITQSGVSGSGGTVDVIDCTNLVTGVYTTGNVGPTPTPKALPKAGVMEHTIIIGAVGILLTIAGLIVML